MLSLRRKSMLFVTLLLVFGLAFAFSAPRLAQAHEEALFITCDAKVIELALIAQVEYGFVPSAGTPFVPAENESDIREGHLPLNPGTHIVPALATSNDLECAELRAVLDLFLLERFLNQHVAMDMGHSGSLFDSMLALFNQLRVNRGR